MRNVTLFYLMFTTFLLWILTHNGITYDDHIRVTLIAVFFLGCMLTLVSALLWYGEKLQADAGHFVIIDNGNRESKNGMRQNGKTT